MRFVIPIQHLILLPGADDLVDLPANAAPGESMRMDFTEEYLEALRMFGGLN